jgi:hypothetical protein
VKNFFIKFCLDMRESWENSIRSIHNLQKHENTELRTMQQATLGLAPIIAIAYISKSNLIISFKHTCNSLAMELTKQS